MWTLTPCCHFRREWIWMLVLGSFWEGSFCPSPKWDGKALFSPYSWKPFLFQGSNMNTYKSWQYIAVIWFSERQPHPTESRISPPNQHFFIHRIILGETLPQSPQSSSTSEALRKSLSQRLVGPGIWQQTQKPSGIVKKDFKIHMSSNIFGPSCGFHGNRHLLLGERKGGGWKQCKCFEIIRVLKDFFFFLSQH